MHPTLERQIKKVFGDQYIPDSQLEQFFKIVDRTYCGYDDGNKLLERSLDISSAELSEINTKLIKEKDAVEKLVEERTEELQAKIKDLEMLQSLAVSRELKMVELKNQINELLEKIGKEKMYNL